MTKHIRSWATAMKARLRLWRQSLAVWFNDKHGGYVKIAAHAKLWTLFACITIFGMTIGAGITHFNEGNFYQARITRLQTINATLLDTINTRLPPITSTLATVSGQIGQAAQVLDQATSANVQATRNANRAAQDAQTATQQAQGAARNAEHSIAETVKALKEKVPNP